VVHWTNPVGVLLLRFVGRNHKKLVLVDDRIAYVGGFNLCDHNLSWHDVMLRVEDERLGAFLRDDVRATLRGENLAHRGDFGGIEILMLDGIGNLRLCEPVLELIRGARESIVVQSPYVTSPFYQYLAQAVSRGVSVTVIAPEQNNKPRLKDYIQRAAGEAGIALRLYTSRMSHLKAMIVDDTALVVGSSNFDYFSFEVQQKAVAIVRDPLVVREYHDTALAADLARCVAPTRTISPAWQSWRERALRVGARLAVRLHCRLDPARRVLRES
jgi:cardiolipin synthase A/B